MRGRAVLFAVAVAAGCTSSATAPSGTEGPTVDVATSAISTTAMATTSVVTTTTAVLPPTAAPATTTMSPASIDRMADWPAPPVTVAALAKVPMLLPSRKIPGATKVTRHEGADDSITASRYEQTWLSANGATAVRITTRPSEPLPPSPIGVPVHLDGWDVGYRQGNSGTISFDLGEPSGSVTVWTAGLASADAVDIASTPERKPDGSSGWTTPAIPSGLTLVNEGWSTGAIGDRTVLWDAHGRLAELWIAVGYPAVFIDTFGVGASTTQVDVNGATAFTFQLGDVAAVVWSPSDGLIARFALIGTVDEALAIACSVRPVDQATWQRASTIAHLQDGCDSLFC